MPSLTDDLLTLIDFCNEMARSEFSTARQAIRDCHDIGHVLTGGDETRFPWKAIQSHLRRQLPALTPAWPDVSRRMVALLARMEAGDAS